MTDRGHQALRQGRDRLGIGPSGVHWNGRELVVDIDERGALPGLGRVRGRVTLTADAITGIEVQLCPDGAHVWRPFAPSARIEVALDAPGWQWSGHGYFDANFGTRALEVDFDHWTWGRFPTRGGAVCFYDAQRRDRSAMSLALQFDKDGAATRMTPPPVALISNSAWQLRRETRADTGYAPHQVRPMLDAPFYCRAAVRTRIEGEETVGVHETLDLRRFRWPWLKPILAMRVPRRPGWPQDQNAPTRPDSAGRPPGSARRPP